MTARDPERDRRLAQALRENLKRRKAGARAAQHQSEARDPDRSS